MDNAQTTARSATVSRDTLETQITVSVCLDGTGKAEFDTGLPFLEHMLDQIARHGMVDLNIKANGDLHIDAHHTVEDIGITLDKLSRRPLGIAGHFAVRTCVCAARRGFVTCCHRLLWSSKLALQRPVSSRFGG